LRTYDLIETKTDIRITLCIDWRCVIFTLLNKYNIDNVCIEIFIRSPVRL